MLKFWNNSRKIVEYFLGQESTNVVRKMSRLTMVNYVEIKNCFSNVWLSVKFQKIDTYLLF